MEWYPLRDEVAGFLGDRATTLFAHAISTQSDCLICSTFFRRILIDVGDSRVLRKGPIHVGRGVRNRRGALDAIDTDTETQTLARFFGKAAARTAPSRRLSDPCRNIPNGKSCKSADQGVDIGTGVVKGERGANGAFHAEAAQNRLSTMMSSPHADSFPIQS